MHTSQVPQDPLLTTIEIATRLRVHTATARRWCAEGVIPATRVGRTFRVTESDLAAYMADQRVTSTPLVVGITQ